MKDSWSLSNTEKLPTAFTYHQKSYFYQTWQTMGQKLLTQRTVFIPHSSKNPALGPGFKSCKIQSSLNRISKLAFKIFQWKNKASSKNRAVIRDKLQHQKRKKASRQNLRKKARVRIFSPCHVNWMLREPQFSSLGKKLDKKTSLREKFFLLWTKICFSVASLETELGKTWNHLNLIYIFV